MQLEANANEFPANVRSTLSTSLRTTVQLTRLLSTSAGSLTSRTRVQVYASACIISTHSLQQLCIALRSSLSLSLTLPLAILICF